MPIRFQVDPDFYDHPKTTGMSDAAFSLWVRAGSFSAAKTTDGFVSEDVLVYTLRSSVEVAEELVGRGLWRRRKGGFQFHQWEVRNLTRARVEADRTADRERKRKERKTGKTHVDREIVRPDANRTPPGVPPESTKNPGVSVSLSVSGSVSGSGHVPNPPRCPDHQDHPDPPNCHRCGEARRNAEELQRQQARAATDRRTAEARQRAADRARAIAACALCDADGQIGRQVCDHDADAANRAARGREAVLAALGRDSGPP
jgi:hypothetical protein